MKRKQKKPTKQAKTRAPTDSGLPRLNAKRLATLFGVAAATVNDWMSKGLPVVHRPGRSGGEVTIDPTQACRWVYRYAGEPAADSALGTERRRFEAARATKLEMQNALLRRQIVLVSYVADFLMQVAAELNQRLDGVAGRLVGEFGGADPARFRARVLEEHRGIRQNLADFIAKLASTPPADEAAGPAPATAVPTPKE